MLNPKRKILLLTIVIAVAMASAVLTAGLLTSQKSVGNTGTVSSIDVAVYNDAAQTSPCTSIDWGTLTEGSTTNRTLYIKNTGNTAETLSMTVSNWNPSTANSVLNLSWNKENLSLPANATVAATITLTVAQDAANVSNFSFDILFTGTA